MNLKNILFGAFAFATTCFAQTPEFDYACMNFEDPDPSLRMYGTFDPTIQIPGRDTISFIVRRLDSTTNPTVTYPNSEVFLFGSFVDAPETPFGQSKLCISRQYASVLGWSFDGTASPHPVYNVSIEQGLLNYTMYFQAASRAYGSGVVLSNMVAVTM